MQESIYLDYMATTPVDPAVITAMNACLGLEGCFANPASLHAAGQSAAAMVAQARQQVADSIGCQASEVVFTSGATESNNLAIKGACNFYKRKGQHVITMATEHKAVLDPCAYLEQCGFEVTYLKPDSCGLLAISQLEQAIRDDTLMISIMLVNNETGVIQDSMAIAACARARGVLFHADATQAVGKMTLDVKQLPVDLLSFSAHKAYGPKGIGGLYVRSKPQLRLEPLIHGGGQQGGFRSGTLPTHQIVGMGEAFALARDHLAQEPQRILQLRDRLWRQLQQLPGVQLNADLKHCIANALNIRIEGIMAETLMLRLPQLAFSAGSACNSANATPSQVLSAMGLSPKQARNSIRLSLGRYTTEEQVERASSLLLKQIKALREISPNYPS